jgi:hypothetical protein
VYTVKRGMLLGSISRSMVGWSAIQAPRRVSVAEDVRLTVDRRSQSVRALTDSQKPGRGAGYQHACRGAGLERVSCRVPNETETR